MTKKNLFLTITLLSFLLGCTNTPATPTDTTNSKPKPPVVKDGYGHLMYSWFAEGKAQTSTKIDDIPPENKKHVRVQDLKVPPENRDPAWIFLADLSQKDKNGQYKVITIEREKYELKRHPSAKATASESKEKTAATVIMYATAHCPHCKTARRWLLEQKIPYKEIDLNKDKTAEAALAQKGQAQGVSTSGVPIFEINGRLLPGFDGASIKCALTMPPLSPQAPKSLPLPPPVQKSAPSITI